MALPDRRPRAIDGGRGAPKSAVLAVTITISVLAAFALGVVVGRSQSGNPSALAPSELAPINTAPMPTPNQQPSGPDIEMIRPDGSRAELAPLAISAAVSDVVAATPQSLAPTPKATAPPETTVSSKLAVKQTVKPSTTAPATQKTTPSQAKGIYTVQLAAFRDRESAERLSLTLESRGYDAYVQRSDVDGKGIWYRVRVGAFEDKEAARELAKRLEAKEGRSAYVTIR